MQLDDTLGPIFDFHAARGATPLRLFSLEHKMGATTLAHDMTTPTEGNDLLMTELLVTYLTDVFTCRFITR